MKTFLAAAYSGFIPFLVFLFFILLSVLHSAYQRSRRSDQTDSGGWDRIPQPLDPGESVEGGGRVLGRYVRTEPVTSALPPPRSDANSPWEREIERVLRRASQPVLPEPAQPTAPPPLPQPSPIPASAWIPPLATTTVEQMEAAEPEQAAMPQVPLANLATAQTAFDHAARLQERVHDFLSRVDSRVDRAAPVVALTAHRPEPSPELKAFVKGLRSPSTARQAILAAMVLAPPKALH